MAERKAPVEPEAAPVERLTRRGRRQLEKVNAAAAKAAAGTASRANAAKTGARTKTALLTEAEKQKAIKAKLRAKRWASVKAKAQAFGRTLMVVGPILAPMSIAWTGQIGFAQKVLEWPLGGGVGYAGAYELSIIFCAWMYHEARKDGDSGLYYRALTWAFALANGVQQWWHWADEWKATPRSVTYSVMTIVGILIWEAYAKLIHRRKLREDGKLGQARPTVELIRWIRYPRISYTAWSLGIRIPFNSFEELWTAAEIERSRRIQDRDRDRDLRKQLKAALARIQELEKPLKVKTERVEPDPAPLDPAPEPPEDGPRQLEAGSESPDPGSVTTIIGPNGEVFDGPTTAEIRAIEEMRENNIPINRTNVAKHIRDNADRLGQPNGIKTWRAARVAEWGRWNDQKAG